MKSDRIKAKISKEWNKKTRDSKKKKKYLQKNLFTYSLLNNWVSDKKEKEESSRHEKIRNCDESDHICQ